MYLYFTLLTVTMGIGLLFRVSHAHYSAYCIFTKAKYIINKV